MEGDTDVPRAFVVPMNDSRWPQELWGCRLGAMVNRVRWKLKQNTVSVEFAEELRFLDFIENPLDVRWGKRIMPAFRHFFTLHGHLDVPQEFVVPSGDESWPKLSWGLKLGGLVNRIRWSEQYAKQVEASKQELVAMGFCFESIAERDWRDKILPSLIAHRNVFRHCIVERSFVVPSCPPWPEKAWGVPLGITVGDMRSKGTFPEQVAHDREILDALGFSWDCRASMWNERILPALEVYVAENGHCRLPAHFVVPSHAPWPTSSWDTDLGMKMYDMKQKGAYFRNIGRDSKRLEEMGYSFELYDKPWKKYVEPLLDIYETLCGDDAVPPPEFAIPSEAPWPEKMWGVGLGRIVANNPQHWRHADEKYN